LNHLKTQIKSTLSYKQTVKRQNNKAAKWKCKKKESLTVRQKVHRFSPHFLPRECAMLAYAERGCGIATASQPNVISIESDQISRMSRSARHDYSL